MTDEMLALAQRNAADAGVRNAIFLRGVIEDVPLPAESVDVVISNCVINLSVDKPAVLAEIGRVLRPGGRVGVSDVVAEDRLSPAERAERGELRRLHRRCALARASTSPGSRRPASRTSRSSSRTRSPTACTARSCGPSRGPSVDGRGSPAGALAGGRAHLRRRDRDGHATFETAVPDWEAWDRSHLAEHRFVAVADGRVLGWAAVVPRLRPLRLRRRRRGQRLRRRDRRAAAASGAGCSRRSSSRPSARGVWTIQTGIFPENEASVRLHERVGFRDRRPARAPRQAATASGATCSCSSAGARSSADDVAPPLARALGGELIGTFALVFAGAGAIMVDAEPARSGTSASRSRSGSSSWRWSTRSATSRART